MTDWDTPDSCVSKDLKKRVRETADHTQRVMENLMSFIFEPDSFNRTHAVDISGIEVPKAVRNDLPILAFIHDLYKIRTSTLHAQQGAQFLKEPTNINVVRFHDVFGVVNTGEASLLFLDELAKFVEQLQDATAVNEFLSKLLILTLTDVAAYGYLNQARIDTFTYLIPLVRQRPSQSQLREMALGDTENRIRRLIQANNRVLVDAEVVAEVWEHYPSRNEVQELLLTARFDYGAYSLEPLIRTALFSGSQYLISDTTLATVSRDRSAVIWCFLECLLDILKEKNRLVIVSKTKVGRQRLKIYDMRNLSVRGNENLPVFSEWAEGFKACVRNRPY